MSLAPLLDASAVVQIHAFLALTTIVLTVAIFVQRKGSRWHRVMGWSWVILMAGVAISSFWINDIRWFGAFGPIHALSVFVLFNLVVGVKAARAHNVALHQRTMKAMTFGALIVAGAFTLFPGRIMFQVLSGG